MPFLVLGVVSRSQLHAVYMQAIFNMIARMQLIKDGYTPKLEFLIGKSNVHQARSMILTRFYDNYCDNDLFLFVDCDQTFDIPDINKAIELNSDVACGVYSNLAHLPTSVPIDPQKFFRGEDDNLKLGGTGFMMIRRPILHKLKEMIAFELGNNDGRVWLGPGDPGVIPFFKERIVDKYVGNPANRMEWFGEDYSFCWLVNKSGGSIKGFISPTITHNLVTPYTFVPPEYCNKKWDENSVVYLCGMSRATFSPMDKTVGGSEQAVIQLAKEWVKKGKSVTVYGNVVPGLFDGVQYERIENFDVLNQFHTIILWRGFGLQMIANIKATNLYVDFHDRTHIQAPPNLLAKIDKAFIKSNDHMLAFPMIPREKMITIPNGVNDMFLNNPPTKHNRNKFIYTSSYDRGLLPILQYIWPAIKQFNPDATLDLYYGSKLLEQQQPELTAHINKLISASAGVTDHGRVDIDTILKARQDAAFHLYFTNNLGETDCISTKESVAIGCIPIISDQNVFKERAGYHIPFNGQNEQQIYLNAVPKILELLKMEDDHLELLRQQYKQEERLNNWEEIASEWLTHF